MDQVEKNQQFYWIIWHLALLFIGLGAIRALTIYQDGLGFVLSFIGFSFVSIHVKFMEKKWGVSRKVSILSWVAFMLVLVPLAYWLSYPR